MNQTIREKILSLAEEEYGKFQSALIPGEDRLLGVRLPLLRKLAKEIAKGDWRSYLSTGESEYFEEVMLQGMVIGYAKAAPEEILQYTAQFIPKIRNWAVCDSFCSGLKITKDQPHLVWDFIQPYLKSGQEFEIRFAEIMMLSYFINDEYFDEVLIRFDQTHHEGYYVKMGIAWAISICFIKYPEKTMDYLKQNNLDDFTFNKSIQKILESNCVDRDTKIAMRTMKRRAK